LVTELRVGLGIDAHRLARGIPLILAGVRFASERGLVGHSDGDVVAHALIDALLGAAGRGDIGQLFPSDEERWSGASSLDLLARAYGVVRMAGFELVNADCVFVGEEPRIVPVRERMQRNLAAAMTVDLDRVTVRATTTDGLGFTGRGEGLAAEAVALVRRVEPSAT
jgi:2-C-methyl-D-erythritol 2,4-cyclodiphosphate synthase